MGSRLDTRCERPTKTFNLDDDPIVREEPGQERDSKREARKRIRELARQESRVTEEGEYVENGIGEAEEMVEMDRLTEALTLLMQAQERQEQLQRERLEQQEQLQRERLERQEREQAKLAEAQTEQSAQILKLLDKVTTMRDGS